MNIRSAFLTFALSLMLGTVASAGQGYVEYTRGKGKPYQSESFALGHATASEYLGISNFGFLVEQQARTFGGNTRIKDDRLALYTSLDFLGLKNTTLTGSYTSAPDFLEQDSVRLDQSVRFSNTAFQGRFMLMYRDYDDTKASDVYVGSIGADVYWKSFCFQQDFIYAKNTRGLSAFSSLTKAIYDFTDRSQFRFHFATGDDLVDSAYTERFTDLGAMFSHRYFAIGFNDHHGSVRTETQGLVQLKWYTP